MNPEICCVLNGGDGAWAFAALARPLADILGIDVSVTPRDFNYLLATDLDPADCGKLFIPYPSIRLAADKRLLAERFAERGVPTPETRLVGSLAEALQILDKEPEREWCLKYPTGCGAAGHRLLTVGMRLPAGWPMPLVVQEFVRLGRPEVYRIYAAGGETFGWVVRRFPEGAEPSPWVAHARGARYELDGEAPAEAVAAARMAFEAAGLLGSFGCADLLRRPSGEWLVLEVGTDGPVQPHRSRSGAAGGRARGRGPGGGCVLAVGHADGTFGVNLAWRPNPSAVVASQTIPPAFALVVLFATPLLPGAAPCEDR